MRQFSIFNFQFSISSGFTLIEILVVISIMGILSVISFAKFATLKEDQSLKSAANDLQSLIRVAQTNAISRVKCGSRTSAATWLIEFRTDQKTIDLKCYTTDPADTLVPIPKTLTFTSTQPQIDNINGQDASCVSSYPNNVISVSFAPLTGAVTFTDKSTIPPPCFAISNLISIILKNPSSSTTKSLILRKGGPIEIQ